MEPTDAHAGPGRAPRTGGLLLACLGALAAYATGELWRPSADAVALAYDLVVYDAVYLLGAAVCRRAAVHRRDDRLVWNALAVALAAVALSTTLYALVLEPALGVVPTWLTVVLWAPAYPAMGVALVGMVRSRVGTPHPSMWFDALTGACGAVIFAVTLLPSIASGPTDGRLAVIQLYPVADTLLLAAVAAVCAVMGFRRDWPLVLIVAGLLCTLAADALMLSRVVDGEVVLDGPLTLTWLAGAAFTALSAHVAGRTPEIVPADADPVARLSWRVAFVPLGSSVMSVAVLVSTWGSAGLGIAGWAAVTCLLATLARTAMSVQELRGLHEIREQARTDELTGLPNRRALLERGRAALAPGSDHPVALLLLDLDGFKEVNDSLGHAAGDDLLRMVGPRLWPELGPGELLARLGGDEFAVLLPGAGLDDAVARAGRLRARVLEPFVVDGVRLHVGVSVGIATGPVPAATVTELLRCADAAMYSAKNAREGVRSYVPDPGSGSGDRLRTMEDLRTALDHGQLVVHLQPQVSLGSGEVVGVEALVRWEHPVRGLLSPAVVLPAAEQAGLMRPLTDAVLGLALGAATRWWPERAVPVSVNLSAAGVTDPDLPATVSALLHAHGLPAAALTLELVEDTLMADPDRGRTVLGELRRLGVRTSIDDYGTGYSSLAYLRHLPADELKLDRSLTADVGRDHRATAIVRHTVALAHDLGLTLVAEGVEDDETRAVLASLGCDVAQGWAVAPPMPVEDLLTWLATAGPEPRRTALLVPAPRVPVPPTQARARASGSGSGPGRVPS
ncbi:putative bifunctional diguanylate cyclase/phosphodiesterase [Blastococcus sp. VKM Ac-2987]|uniref:putative bifunctional diguanylate cyclase/phosphodiesterase n=1 Tax=Blastococcus sp. VKM Ac-2987 TaxID=3004141 RepID=UPI0022AB5AF8|nr:EAL domain-containing protein [Blastococcus sp. VKM Ac-2987]MCZ2857164.1 EAL domain-containing protein [Blastococcus sp. VKM Ac-2987]